MQPHQPIGFFERSSLRDSRWIENGKDLGDLLSKPDGRGPDGFRKVVVTMSAVEYLEHRGISPDAMLRFGLDFDSSANALAIPAIKAGRQIGTQYRYLSADSDQRYQWLLGSQPWPFNWDGVSHPSTQIVIVCEGAMDALTAWDALGRVGEARKSALVLEAEAVGLPSANGWRREYAEALAGKRVIVLADGDDGGKRLLKSAEKDLDFLCSYPMPYGLDVNSYARRYGRLTLRNLIQKLVLDTKSALLRPKVESTAGRRTSGKLVVPILRNAGFDIRCSDTPGVWFSIRCPLPGHDDRHNSASIAPDGLLFYCAQCTNGKGEHKFPANALKAALGLREAA